VGGYIAALAGGSKYGNLYDGYLNLMAERVFAPIGMTSSTFSISEVENSDNYSLPHHKSFLEGEVQIVPLASEKFFTPIAPAGGLWSNVLDLGRYLITELNGGVAPNGERVVSRANLEKTWEPQVAITADSSYGLGWFIDEYHGLRLIHHNGNSFGFTSDVAFLPEAKLGVVVLTNGGQTNFFNEAIRQHLFALLFEQETEADPLAILPDDSAPLPDLKVAIAPFLGRYYNKALGEVTIKWEDDSVILDAGEFQSKLSVSPDGDGKVAGFASNFWVSGTEVKFSQNDRGKPIFIFGSGLSEYTFEKLN
jgi:hypothetical protein